MGNVLNVYGTGKSILGLVTSREAKLDSHRSIDKCDNTIRNLNRVLGITGIIDRITKADFALQRKR